jgi:hypothetical protein
MKLQYVCSPQLEQIPSVNLFYVCLSSIGYFCNAQIVCKHVKIWHNGGRIMSDPIISCLEYRV